MGSRPSSKRRNGANGSVNNNRESELRAENSKMMRKIIELEHLQVPHDEVKQEIVMLRQENEDLKRQLTLSPRSLSAGILSNSTNDEGFGGQVVRENRSFDEGKLERHLKSKSNNEPQRTPSGNAKSDADKMGDESPMAPKKPKQPRKINPRSIPQTLSDIDAYGQGLPLPDAEKLRENIRRSRHKQRRNDSGNSTGSSVGLSVDTARSDRAESLSPERTDQRDVFLGVESLKSGGEESDTRSTSEAKEDLL